mgnify:CR=1 FL=1
MVDVPSFDLPKLKSIPEHSYDALVEEMERFQRTLGEGEEMGIVANGGGLVIHVEAVRYSGQMIVFSGVDPNGNDARLVQHYTQTNVQMISVSKLEDEPRRIGF